MNNTQTMNRNYETIAWGVLFIWWGITELIPFLPNGIGLIGIGLILIGVNVARWLNSIAILLIVLGAIILVPELAGKRNA
jgi:hypothetical protein